MSVSSYLRHWLAHMRSRVRATTFEGYRALIECHAVPHLGEVRLDHLQPLDLQGLYTQLLSPEPPRPALSPGSVRNLHLVLAQAFKQAVAWRLLPSSPATGAQPPRPRPRTYPVADPTLLRRLLDALSGHPLELAAAFAITTGMRRGEILALCWDDLNPDRTLAHVNRSLQATTSGLRFEEPKTRRSRRAVALPQLLNPYLERQQAAQAKRQETRPARWQHENLVVDRGDGCPWNPDSFSSAWRRFIRQHGLPHLRFHDLRHGHATLMLLQGVHPKIVSERLGHASIGITLDTYYHLLPSMQEDAVAAIDALFATTPA